MCGRFALHSPAKSIQKQFGVAPGGEYSARYNIAPSQMVPVVRVVEGERVLVPAKWGLMPHWEKESDKGPHPINARAETAAIRPMFRQAFRNRRILVPADAFYEWRRLERGKQPYLIHMKDGAPFGMGGLLEYWEAPQGEVITFTILTTTANPLMAPIHDRMPVIIHPDHYEAWLDPELKDVSKIQALIGPFPERLMEAYPISSRVNSPRNDSADLLRPLGGERPA
ncbi:MAG: SOS response-associated peptidase [Betaproteobacteria bacterium]|nr:SOS response-associated peptidase [Betaproteobacteria bacterium]